MRILKTCTAAALAALTLTGALVGSSAPASAENGRNGALIGGLAAGALLGGAVAAGAAGGNPGYYAPAPAYAAPGGCYMQRRPIYDEYGDVAGYRRVRVCD